MALPRDDLQPFTTKNGNLLLKVKAFPKAGENRIAGVRNGELVVRIQAPAVRGQANKELVKLLSKSLGVGRSEITILSGESSRHKLIGLPLTARSALEEIS
jgi:uncharacterized protein (TIGR00251 family)